MNLGSFRPVQEIRALGMIYSEAFSDISHGNVSKVVGCACTNRLRLWIISVVPFVTHFQVL